MNLVRVRYLAEDGTQAWLDDELRHYDMPVDLEPPGIAGNRAVDASLIWHSGDRLATSYGITATGTLMAKSPDELMALYWRVKKSLRSANRVYRGAFYLNVAYGLLGASKPDRGQTAIETPTVFAVSDMRWRNERDEVVS